MKHRPPLVLRLIRVGPVCLVTDMTDPRRLSARTAAELYRRRWGLEVAFRSLKQTLERRRVRSGTAARRGPNWTGRCSGCGCWPCWAWGPSRRRATARAA